MKSLHFGHTWFSLYSQDLEMATCGLLSESSVNVCMLDSVCVCVVYMPLFIWQVVIAIYKSVCLYTLHLYVMYICQHTLLVLYVCDRMFTCAGKFLGWRGEQQFVSHVARPGTAGDAGLLVTALHPVRQPLHVAVAVQRVGSQSAANQKKSQTGQENTFQLWRQQKSDLSRQSLCFGLWLYFSNVKNISH